MDPSLHDVGTAQVRTGRIDQQVVIQPRHQLGRGLSGAVPDQYARFGDCLQLRRNPIRERTVFVDDQSPVGHGPDAQPAVARRGPLRQPPGLDVVEIDLVLKEPLCRRQGKRLFVLSTATWQTCSLSVTSPHKRLV